MAISNRKRKLILRGYPELSIEELTEKLGLKRRDVVRVLEEAGVSVDEKQRDSISEPPRLGFEKVQWFAILIIAVATIVVYANSLQNNFHYDDFHSLTRNINIRYLSNIPKFFTHPEFFSSKPNVAMPRPILLSTFALNFALTEYNAWGWIFVNLLLHVANAILLYVVICHLAGRPRIALLAALIFALHPVNTETVNYVNCRSESLGALFLLLTIYFFCRDLRESRPGLYIASLGCYATGLITKETVFVTPALIVVIDALFIFKPGTDSISRRVYTRYLPLAVISLLYLDYRNVALSSHRFGEFTVICLAVLALLGAAWLLRMIYRTGAESFSRHLSTVYVIQILVSGAYFIYLNTGVKSYTFIEKANRPVFENVLTQTRSFVHYFNLLLCPIHLNTSYENIDYPGLIQDGVIWNMLFIAALAGVGLFLWRRMPVVTLFVLNFFITLAPTTSVIPLNAYMNEHRVYLPSMGFAILAAAAIEKLRTLSPFKIKSPRNLINLIIIFILTLYASLLVGRNFIWKTDMSLWTDTITKSPHKAQVVSDLGNAYYRNKPSNIERAALLYKWSVRMDERYFKAHHNLGTVNFTWGSKSKSPEKARLYYLEAEKYFRHALRIMPINAETWNDLGSTYIKLKKLKEAEKCYRQAVHFDKKNYKAMMNLGIILDMQERYDEAIDAIRQSIRVYDLDPLPYYFLYKMLIKLERHNEALEAIKGAYELEPQNEKFRKPYENLFKYLKTQGGPRP